MFAYARRPVRTAVEVGAGTGKATRLFAGRGVAVTALEPDPDMLSVLQRTTAGLPVIAVRVEFEEFESDQQFDLVYAAAAWHWTDAETRWHRAVQLLARGGIVAAFGRPADIADPELFAAVDEIERRLLSMEPSMNGGAADADGMAGYGDASGRGAHRRRTARPAQ
ncbi:MAG: methyltransferase domain-containing protein [Nocardioidaceae bacterium]